MLPKPGLTSSQSDTFDWIHVASAAAVHLRCNDGRNSPTDGGCTAVVIAQNLGQCRVCTRNDVMCFTPCSSTHAVLTCWLSDALCNTVRPSQHRQLRDAELLTDLVIVTLK
jgi:hypothetical protein